MVGQNWVALQSLSDTSFLPLTWFRYKRVIFNFAIVHKDVFKRSSLMTLWRCNIRSRLSCVLTAFPIGRYKTRSYLYITCIRGQWATADSVGCLRYTVTDRRHQTPTTQFVGDAFPSSTPKSARNIHTFYRPKTYTSPTPKGTLY